MEQSFDPQSFKNRIRDSLQYISSMKTSERFQNKDREGILKAIEEAIFQQTVAACHDYFRKIIKRMIVISLPLWSAIAIIAGLFLLSLFGVPVTQGIPLKLTCIAIVLIGYTFVLAYSIPQPDPTDMIQKISADYALRVVDMEDGKEQGVSSDLQKLIKKYLSDQERQNICQEVNRVIARLQTGK